MKAVDEAVFDVKIQDGSPDGFFDGEPEAPAELTDRKMYDTPIGQVCISKTEHEAYLEEVEMRKMKK